MRTARLLSVVLAVLTAGALFAPAALADTPARLTEYVTDTAGALSAAGRADVERAVDTLYADRHIRLWVVYVDDFSGQSPDDWGQATTRLNYFGGNDALLAVATRERSYAFLVSSAARNVTSSQVTELRRNRIEPALHGGDWAGAAVAAADGLGRSSSGQFSWQPVLIILAVAALAAAVLTLILRLRRSRRRAAELAAAHGVDPTDRDALAALPVHVLDELARSKVVEVDNAVRTSSNELDLAVEEFGPQRTEPFRHALENAKAALSQAFRMSHQLHDAIPETPAQRREMLTSVIVAAAEADRELEAQSDAFELLRDLVINAPSRLDGLTQQLVELTARIPSSEQRLVELRNEFDPAALSSVSSNVATGKERLSFADHNITRARELAARAIAGGQGELVDTVRAAESAVGQIRALLDAVDSAAGDIRHAESALPAAISDIEAGITHARTLLDKGSGSHRSELTAALDAAVRAVASARGCRDPLSAFTRLTTADGNLDRLVDTLEEERAASERLHRTLEQALFAAQSRVRAVSDYIDTRRGSIGPEARTRLAEAQRHLDAAQDTQVDVSTAIAHANNAAALAAQAQSLAKADAQTAQQAYYGRYGGGDSTGAMLGGIIIGNILSGGGHSSGGYSGGWSPTSFGGSDPGGGGFFGGGGRF